jgi:hypothetical protein
MFALFLLPALRFSHLVLATMIEFGKIRPMDETSALKDKVALVVVGASGMGNALTRLLAWNGCRTHVFDVKAAASGLFQLRRIQFHAKSYC